MGGGAAIHEELLEYDEFISLGEYATQGNRCQYSA